MLRLLADVVRSASSQYLLELRQVYVLVSPLDGAGWSGIMTYPLLDSQQLVHHVE
jgi:hypothetical protein